MVTIEIIIPEIPHGHGLSFKKGLADGLLENERNKDSCHATHAASYLRGHDVGAGLKQEISKHVKA